MTTDNNADLKSLSVQYEDILLARERIKEYIHFTPVFTNQTLNNIVRENGPGKIEILCKGEFLQKTGSFKSRGSLNSVLAQKDRDALQPDVSKRVSGVMTESSGNNGMALAWSASIAGYPGVVVIHRGASTAKAKVIADYGAELVWCEPSIESRKATVKTVSEERNLAVIYDNDDLIAGQGTVGLEFLEQVPDLDAILVPTSGGGMVAGISVAAKRLNPNIKIFIVEPKGKNSEQSLKAGERLWKPPFNLLETIADGIRMPVLGVRTWPIILQNVEKEIFTISDEELTSAMKFVYQRMKLVVEVTGAAGIAAVMSDRFKFVAKEMNLNKVGVILCGGNANLDTLPWIKSEEKT